MIREQPSLHTYLADRAIWELRWLQQSLDCPMEGKKSRRRHVIEAIEKHAGHVGLTREQAKAIVDHGELIHFGKEQR